MSETIAATYDGEVLRLSQTLDISKNTKVWVTIETTKPKRTKGFLAVARSANLDGPADWAENLDQYLYENKPID